MILRMRWGGCRDGLRRAMVCAMKLVKLDTLLACFAHFQHGIAANTQVIKFFILRTALQVNCVYCWLGANEVIRGYYSCEWDRNS